MPTKLRRIALSLPPDLDAQLARFSELTGCPQSKFVLDCLMSSMPMLEAICQSVEAAKAGDHVAAENLLHQSLGRAIAPLLSTEFKTEIDLNNKD